MKDRRSVVAIIAVALFATGTHIAAAQETILYSFVYGGSDGLLPAAGLISDGKGNFYGTTVSGGSVGAPFGSDGTVFELSPGAGGVWTEKVLYDFGVATNDGTQPVGGVVFDAKGSLYGTTSTGGTTGYGTVYELSPGAGGVWTEKILYDFLGGTTDGGNPERGSLIFDAKGNLYGTTKTGGPYAGTTGAGGTVFELSPAGGTWTEKVLYSFGATGTDGNNPVAGLIFDAAGNLYSTTLHGGAYSEGTVFELSPEAGGGWTEKVLHSFDINGVDGAQPYAGVIIDGQGNLYGTTNLGGKFGQGNHLGAVFELSPNAEGTWTEQVLYSFTGAPDGYYPYGGLVFDAAGNLYGTTNAGGTAGGHGTVFVLFRAAIWNEQVLYSFAGSSDGASPLSVLMFDAVGNVYGTTSAGGTNSFGLYGTVFELASVVTASPKFSPRAGAYSGTQMVKITDSTPNTTIYYTINGGLPAKQYTAPIKVSSSETITAFATSGALPRSQPAIANYQIGTTAATPWFSPPAGTYTVAQSVTITDAAPGATIYYTKDGTTPTTSSPKYKGPISVTSTETIEALAVASGYSDSAIALAKYTITPITPPVEKVLYDFGATGEDGNVPVANLVLDGKGNLYGTTEFGGTTGYGTVYELSPGTGGVWTEKILYSFSATGGDAAGPTAGMVFDSKGNLYGTTFGGGAYGLGTVFELFPGSGGTWTEKVLYSFGVSLADGKSPEGGVIFDAQGNLYGTTNIGGSSDTTYGGGYGTVFELSPGTGGAWTEQILYNFSYLSQTDGYFPEAGLVFDAAGNLYGTTADGGAGQDLEGGGTVFELSPAGGGGWTEKILYNFGGGAPQGYLIAGGVVLDGAGNVYGTAYSGGNGFGLDGTLFELSPAGGGTWTFQVLHSFGAYEGDGINPSASMIFDATGNLCGTTSKGGANGYGTVFQLMPETGGGWIENVVHSFNLSSTDGANPYSALTVDGGGNLYGTTAYGGTYGTSNLGGTVFEIESTTTKATTTTKIVSSQNPSTFEQSVTFTATVTPESSGTPEGMVTFIEGTTTLKTVTLSGGVAKYTTKTLAVGKKSITAVYSGSALFTASTSAVLHQVINQASTTTTLVSSLNPSTVGQSVTFTATVAPEFSGTPKGTVTFMEGTTALGTVGLSGGVAAYSTTKLSAGKKSMTAVYNGSSSFIASTSAVLHQVVNPAGTATSSTARKRPVE